MRSPRPATGDGEDRLSALDDDALREILARLPLRDAAVTTALSTRWPRVFATLPRLRLDSTTFNARASLDLDYCDDNGRWVDGLDCVLACRLAPVVAFEVDVDIDLLEQYDDWFYSFFGEVCRGGGLRELRVVNNHVHECYLLPSPVYACETLTSLELDSCRLRVPGKLTGLRSVRSLWLRKVVAEDADLRRMISRCRAVERLVLEDCRRMRNVVIRGPSLKELEIHSYRPLRIVVKKAPHLESVKLSLSYTFPDCVWSHYDNSDGETARKRADGNAVQELFNFGAMQKREHEKADEATNIITFFSGLSCAKELFLYLPYKFAKVLSKTSNSVPMSLPKKCYLRGLQKLALVLDYNDGGLPKVVSCLLNSSPNLRDLEIHDPYDYKERRASSVAPEFWEKNASSECVQNHLSNVTFYLSIKSLQKCSYIGFSKFLVMRARALQRLSFIYQRCKDQQHCMQPSLRGSEGSSSNAQGLLRMPWWKFLPSIVSHRFRCGGRVL
ncbi:hypothetical protein ACP70R_038200 [Stipagrostis hirtigluma subsp. patula]